MLKEKRCRIRTRSQVAYSFVSCLCCHTSSCGQPHLSPRTAPVCFTVQAAVPQASSHPLLFKHNKQQANKNHSHSKICWGMQRLFAQLLAYSSCWSQGLWLTAEKHTGEHAISSPDLNYASEYHILFTAVWSLFTFSQLEDNLLFYLNTWKST